MKPPSLILLLALAMGGITSVRAQLSIPSDGSDGAFNPGASVVVDLGQAATSAWNASGNGNGVYDPDKWAVVFKYSSVNIPAGVKVTFKNHPSYAPVVWLVQGNVTIAGEVNLDGQNGTQNATDALVPAEPGPGGFRGAAYGPSGSGSGYGPGGVLPAIGGGAATYASTYGNPQIIPLIGGSGGGVYTSPSPDVSGSAGGGAIGIFTPGNISLPGVLSAKGGAAGGTANFSQGSGGAIRLVANSVTGSGTVICVTASDNATTGRIRIETASLSPTLQISPETVGVPPASPPIIWSAANTPVAKVISVDAVGAPSDPHAPLVASADVAIQNSNSVAVLIQTTNFPIEGVVQLIINPKFGNRNTVAATRVSGDINLATWRVMTTFPQGFTTLQARATQP